jgi:hypothetical protein
MKLNKIIFVLITSLVLLSDLLPPAHNMYAKANGNAIYSVSMTSDYEDIDYRYISPIYTSLYIITNLYSFRTLELYMYIVASICLNIKRFL